MFYVDMSFVIIYCDALAEALGANTMPNSVLCAALYGREYVGVIVVCGRELYVYMNVVSTQCGALIANTMRDSIVYATL